MPRTLKPIRGASLRVQVFEMLRQAIFAGDFTPGDALREVHLANDLQVSQSTVREALVQLEHIGLVTRVLNKGTTVTELSERDIQERVAVRLPLEKMAFLEAARRMTAEQFEQLEARMDDLSAAVEANEYFEAAQADLHFHSYVWRCAGNEVLCRHLTQLTVPLFAFVSMKRQQDRQNLTESTRSHEDIIASLRSGDEGAIAQTLREHLELTYDVPESET